MRTVFQSIWATLYRATPVLQCFQRREILERRASNSTSALFPLARPPNRPETAPEPRGHELMFVEYRGCLLAQKRNLGMCHTWPPTSGHKWLACFGIPVRNTAPIFFGTLPHHPTPSASSHMSAHAERFGGTSGNASLLRTRRSAVRAGLILALARGHCRERPRCKSREETANNFARQQVRSIQGLVSGAGPEIAKKRLVA